MADDARTPSMTFIAEKGRSVMGNVFSRSNRETWITIACLIMFYALAIAFYMPVEGFGLGDCIYFATVMVSTVGYGDFLPTSDGSKIFTIVYIHFALLIVAVALGNLEQAMLQQWVHSMVLKKHEQIGIFDEKAKLRRRRKQFGIALASYTFFTVVGTVVFATAEDWDEERDGNKWVNGWYLTAITLTTVGFGDYSPTKDGTKLFGCWMMLFGVPLVATSLALFSELVFGGSKDAIKLHTVRGLNSSKFKSLQEFCTELTKVGARNAADESKISKLEFMTFLLVKNEVVEMSDVELMMKNFCELDKTDTGFIGIDDAERSPLFSERTPAPSSTPAPNSV
eukprot:gnl/TRDRNA2_/TRDRNA2_42864_c1_seq1.p1 gnl/TRDRNA2_/TRDRNA2_42864_c1~~gnl/TRDRNA2_/TRDRNA2_42864_c1_seq1.p1  ORF type:complete len:339 (-),score=45.96 gnl/TRDRNA2_/TRDRNA2_42864_c1_seq1:265-1281(-)